LPDSTDSVTGNFELDFQAIGRLYPGDAFDFSPSFFLAFSDGNLDEKKNGQVPHS